MGMAEPGPHLWEASALTTAQSLLLPLSGLRYFFSHCVALEIAIGLRHLPTSIVVVVVLLGQTFEYCWSLAVMLNGSKAIPTSLVY